MARLGVDPSAASVGSDDDRQSGAVVTVEHGVMCIVTVKDVLCLDTAATLVDLTRAALVRTNRPRRPKIREGRDSRRSTLAKRGQTPGHALPLVDVR